MADQLLPVLDQIGAAGVQEADLGVGVHRRQSGEGPVQLGDVAAVQPVRGVREQQVAGALQHRLHPPSQPIPGVEGAAVAGALLPKRSRCRNILSSAVVVSTRSACSPSQPSAIPGSIRTAERNSSSACG
ncbi:hypothetical protein SPURM210S_00848 [Streptomyces purpurascens]